MANINPDSSPAYEEAVMEAKEKQPAAHLAEPTNGITLSLLAVFRDRQG
jgi:hypothetical protein